MLAPASRAGSGAQAQWAVGGRGLRAGTSHPTCPQWSPGESRSFAFRVTRWQPKASFVFERALQKMEM